MSYLTYLLFAASVDEMEEDLEYIDEGAQQVGSYSCTDIHVQTLCTN